MSDFYSIAPCPKCKSDVWKRMGGHHAIPIYFECLKCGLDTNKIRAMSDRIAQEEGRGDER